MADEELLEKIHGLGDLDLAGLLCLVNREHCIITTDSSVIDDLAVELQLVASRCFGLRSTVVEFSPRTTHDDLNFSLSAPQTHRRRSSLSTTPSVPPATPAATGAYQPANVVIAKNLNLAHEDVQIQCLEMMRTRRISTRTGEQSFPKQFLFIAVLAEDDDREATSYRENRHSHETPRLKSHLNDLFYISHWHDPEDGFPYLDELEEEEAENKFGNRDLRDGGGRYESRAPMGDRYAQSSDSDDSVVVVRNRSSSRHSGASRRSGGSRPQGGATPRLSQGPSSSGMSTGVLSPGLIMTPTTAPTTQQSQSQHQYTTPPAGLSAGSSTAMAPGPPPPLFSEPEIASLERLARDVSVDVDVLRYQQNIIAFLRLHRAVARISAQPGLGGAPVVSPAASRALASLTRSLSALHGLDYATPSLVALAARKVYRHRVRVVEPERERSVQWGSDVDAVAALLRGVGPDDVIEDVLGMVEAPL